MITLAVETSGVASRIALRIDGVLFEERELDRTGQKHAQSLISEVKTLLTNANLTPRDVSLLAVSHGPGSFTGLRVGIVFAKTFALATGCPIVAVETLQAIAEAAPPDVLELAVISDAQREQVFASRWWRRADRFEPTVVIDNAVWIAEVTALAAAGTTNGGVNPFAVSGPGLLKLSPQLPPGIRVLDSSLWQPRASHVARIGERLAAAGQFVEAFALEPFYLRASSAEEKLARLNAPA